MPATGPSGPNIGASNGVEPRGDDPRDAAVSAVEWWLAMVEREGALRPIWSLSPSVARIVAPVVQRLLAITADATQGSPTEWAAVALLALPRLFQQSGGAVAMWQELLQAADVAEAVREAVDSRTAAASRTAVDRVAPCSVVRQGSRQPAPSRPVGREGGEQPPPGESRLPIRRLAQLTRNGCSAKALKVVESCTNSVRLPLTEGNIAQLQALFPPASVDDRLPAGLLDACAHWQATEEEVVEGLARLPRQSSPGFSGWTYEVIRQLVAAAPSTPGFIRAIRRLVNRFMRGEMGDARIWCVSRVVPLAKKQSLVPRPICVLDSWLRLVARIAARHFAGEAATALAPTQFGVGVPGGAEYVVHTSALFAALYQDRNDCVIDTVDVTNAFNCVSRSAVFSGVESLVPGLAAYVRWAYGTTSPMYADDGTYVGTCGTGVRQGDPLGSLLFSVAIHPVLAAVAERYPEVAVLGYLDDGTLIGVREDVDAAKALMTRRLAVMGLRVNPSKCRRWVGGGVAEQEPLHVLGVPIGHPTAVKEAVEAVCDTQSSVIPLLSSLPPSVAFAILHACVNARPVFLARCAMPATTVDALRAFDRRVTEGLTTLMGLTGEALPNTADAIRGLPLRLGGLGLRRLQDLAEMAFTSSFLRAASSMPACSPLLLQLLEEHADKVDDVISVVERVTPNHVTRVGPRVTLTIWAAARENGGGVVPPETPSQRHLLEQEEERMVESVQAELANSGDRACGAWLRSSTFKGSGRWLLTPTQATSAACRLAENEFRANLLLRLGVRPSLS